MDFKTVIGYLIYRLKGPDNTWSYKQQCSEKYLKSEKQTDKPEWFIFEIRLMHTYVITVCITGTCTCTNKALLSDVPVYSYLINANFLSVYFLRTPYYATDI